MARHRLFDAKRGKERYTHIGPTGQLIHMLHATIWLTPKSQLAKPWAISVIDGKPYYTIDTVPILRSRNTHECESSLPVALPEDLADEIIDFIEDSGGRVEIWQANFIRQIWGGPRRCIKCKRPTDSGKPLCAICEYGRT